VYLSNIIVIMEFGKQHDPNDFCPRQLVIDYIADLSFTLRTYRLNGETGVMDFRLYVVRLCPSVL